MQKRQRQWWDGMGQQVIYHSLSVGTLERKVDVVATLKAWWRTIGSKKLCKTASGKLSHRPSGAYQIGVHEQDCWFRTRTRGKVRCLIESLTARAGSRLTFMSDLKSVLALENLISPSSTALKFPCSMWSHRTFVKSIAGHKHTMYSWSSVFMPSNVWTNLLYSRCVHCTWFVVDASKSHCSLR